MARFEAGFITCRHGLGGLIVPHILGGVSTCDLRIGAKRVPSCREVVYTLESDSPGLADNDWEMNRMSIPEPKVEHHEGRGIRSCPILPSCSQYSDGLAQSCSCSMKWCSCS